MIRTAQDYRDVTYEYLVGCAREGAVYVELIASPDHAASVGLPDAEHYGGIAAGHRRRARRHGIEARILAAAIRNFGVEAAEAIARRAAEDRHPYVVGFNLAGDEAGYPPGAVRPRRTRSPPTPASAAPSTRASTPGAESVREALTLPITRMSHGVRAIEDPRWWRSWPSAGIVLEACPTSNVATGVYAGYETHPLRALYEAGVKITLGSDDPPYFGASIGGEYAVARERLGFEEGELRPSRGPPSRRPLRTMRSRAPCSID